MFIIDDVLFDIHIANTTLPETPSRTKTIRKALLPLSNLTWIKPIPISLTQLYETHSQAYVNHVITQCQKKVLI